MADNMEAPFIEMGMDTEVFGNLKDAEAFLSDTASTANSVEDLEEIDENEEPPKKSAPKKVEKKEEKKEEEVSAKDIVEDFLSDEKEPKEEKEEETKEEEEEPSNQIEAFSKDLYKLGVLSVEEGEEPIYAKEGEDLVALLNREKQKGGIQWVENFLEQYGEDRRELFDAIFIKGADPKEYLPVYNQAQALENLDLEQEKNQEKVVREFYRRAKVPEEKIDTKIQRLKDIAELQSEAEDFHPQLLEQDKQKAAEIAEAAEEQIKSKAAIEQIYKDSLTKLVQEKGKGKDINGLPITPKALQESMDFLLTKKWKLADGSLLTDFDKFVLETKKPENVEKRLIISLLEKNGWDFSKIQSKAISTKSSELFESLVHKDTKNKQKQKPPEPSGW